jgi:hypothetical protein
LTIEAKKKFIIMLAISTHISQSSIGLAVTVISKSAMFPMERYEGMLAKGTGTATWIIQRAPMDQVTLPQEHVHGWHFHSDWNGIELLCITLYTPFGNGEGRGSSVCPSFYVRPSHHWNFAARMPQIYHR